MKLILLDRDGVLNRIFMDPEHGVVRSPLHPSQVSLLPGVGEALRAMQSGGYQFAITTNQPGAAKGETTLENLHATHAEVLRLLEAEGVKIRSSHLCLHRKEDACLCRKPLPGLLLAALAQNPPTDLAGTWMVGDGIVDVQAGAAAQVATAFLGPKKPDAYGIFHALKTEPDFWGEDLREFARHLLA